MSCQPHRVTSGQSDTGLSRSHQQYTTRTPQKLHTHVVFQAGWTERMTYSASHRTWADCPTRRCIPLVDVASATFEGQQGGRHPSPLRSSHHQASRLQHLVGKMTLHTEPQLEKQQPGPFGSPLQNYTFPNSQRLVGGWGGGENNTKELYYS